MTAPETIIQRRFGVMDVAFVAALVAVAPPVGYALAFAYDWGFVTEFAVPYWVIQLDFQNVLSAVAAVLFVATLAFAVWWVLRATRIATVVIGRSRSGFDVDGGDTPPRFQRGRPAALIVWLIPLLVIGAFFVGRYNARTQARFAVIASSPPCAVIRRYDAALVCATIDTARRVIGPSFRLMPVADSSNVYRLLDLSAFRPAGRVR